MAFIYLASPYTHTQQSVMQMRHDVVARLTAELLRAGEFIYSPIVHCHELAVKYDLPRDISFWENYNRAMLSQARELRILQLPGWKNSNGIAFEIGVAKQHGIPITFIEPRNNRGL